MNTISDVFRKTAKKFYHHFAIKTESEAITYAELDEQVQNYAPPADKVVIVSDKNVGLLYSRFIAIMRSGKPYFYLDPDLTDAVKITLRDTIHNKLANNQTALNSISCIVQTSGTTQQPRLLGLTHAGVLHNIQHYQHTLQIGPQDKLGLLSTPQFSAATATIYSALLSGACLCPFAMKNSDIDAMINWVAMQEITVLHLTPSLLRIFAQWVPRHYLPALRAIKVGGETLYPADVLLFRQQFPATCILVNGLGMSEVGGNISHYILNQNTRIDPCWKVIPVGKVLSGHEVTIIDDKITVHSPYLAVDKWEEAASTEVKTLTTHDIGYFDHDGLLFHIGRDNRVIKRNGYRIDLTAIESALIDLPAVENAYTYFTDRLIACVISSLSIDQASLLQILSEKLPRYMLPQQIFVLPTFPLTASGKIDQRKLLELVQTPYPSALVEPRNEIEYNVQHLWQKILSCKNISIYDNFFELGGDSLKAMELIARLMRDYHIPYALSAVATHPSIAEMAELILRQDPGQTKACEELHIDALPLRQNFIDKTLAPLVFIPGGAMSEKEIMLYAGLLPYLNANRFCVTLRANLLQTKIYLPKTLEEIAELAAATIMQGECVKPPIIVGECVACMLALEVSRILKNKYLLSPLLILLNPWHPCSKANTASSLALTQYYEYLCQFDPSPYSGNVHLILAEERSDSRSNCFNWWSERIQGRCELHLAPGNSQTYIRLHRKHLAAIINQIS